jgi:Ca2+-binding EF-hand superfamily protein
VTVHPHPQVRECFELLDADGSGHLDKLEVGNMMLKMKKVFRHVEFDPPFQLDRDFEKMDTDGHGDISYEEFEQWYAAGTPACIRTDSCRHVYEPAYNHCSNSS